MFSRFIYAQCSLAESFWKFSVLGLLGSSCVARFLMIFLKQTVGYRIKFLNVLLDNISILSMNPKAFAIMCFYIGAFLAVIVYSMICVAGMWNAYKEYNKSKLLAILAMLTVWVIIFFAIKFSIY